MSVSLSPSNSLGFNRPLTQLVKRSLAILNPNSQPVAFKVKTTAPKLYCVRPNSGRIEPGETVEVAVMLQAMREEPPLAAKCRDKFLIQSTVITREKQTMPLQDIWNATDGGEDVKVHQQKLKVVYLPAEGQTLEEEEEEGPANMGSTIGGAEPQFETVRQHPNGHSADPIPDFGAEGHEQEHGIPATQEDPESQVTSDTEQPLDRPHTPPADFIVAREESADELAPYVDTSIQPPSTSAPDPERQLESHANAELLAKYHDALAEIDRLQGILASEPSSPSNELRRRHRALSDDGSTMGETDAGTMAEEGPLHQEGVPLQVVVIIALGVFITTYLFF